MKSTVRKKRKSRRVGPIHFAQGIFLEALGLAALIFVLLGLGQENWFISLISSPTSEQPTVAINNTPTAFAPTFGESWKENTWTTSSQANSDRQPLTGLDSTWTSNPDSQTDHSAWQSNTPSELYLGHNTPWTSHH